MDKPQLISLITGATATGSGETFIPWGSNRVFQAYGSTSSGSGAATILIEVSLTGETNHWITLGTISLTLGTTVTTDGFASDAPWKYCRARVSAISGTGASVTAIGAIVRHS